MRRTTQWAVFTSMNRQQPAWRAPFEPAEAADAPPDSVTSAAAQSQRDSRTAPDTRRDRVDFM